MTFCLSPIQMYLNATWLEYTQGQTVVIIIYKQFHGRVILVIRGRNGFVQILGLLDMLMASIFLFIYFLL